MHLFYAYFAENQKVKSKPNEVLNHAILKGYTKIYLIGFSLGGNLTLKYLGEKKENADAAIQKAITFCAPIDLCACSMEIIRPRNVVYMRRFLKTLERKVKGKATIFPDKIDLTGLERVKTLYDFDDVFTSKIHGFKDAEDYYRQCSALYFVNDIKISTLIVNSENDPMVPIASIPKNLPERNKALTLEISPEGGHCGFRPAKLTNGSYWSELRALNFLKNG